MTSQSTASATPAPAGFSTARSATAWSSHRAAGSVAAALVLAVGGSCSSPLEPTPNPPEVSRTPPPGTPTGPDGSFSPPAPMTCPDPSVEVRTADALTRAVQDAQPGDVIRVADGTYSGNFTATARATSSAPIFLCGSAAAVLDAGGIKNEYVLHLDGAAYWRVVGLTVRNGQKGVMADGVQHTVLQDLTVETTGDEAVHLRRDSSDNVVRDSTVRDTGHRRAKFGEGIYVGTATSNWCAISSCRPDASDRNLILNNTVSGTTAESVDLKEGTSDGVVHGNTFDGSALSGADSWLDAKGNDWLVAGNSGAHSPVDGFQTHVVAKGWGERTIFEDNVGRSLATEDPEGVLVGLHPDRDSVVRCSNRVSDGSAPVSTVSCR